MQTEYGHIRVKFGNYDYTLSPTLESMSLIGSKEDIMQVLSKLHCSLMANYISLFDNHSQEILNLITKYNKKVTGPEQLQAAILVLQCCCKEDLSPMIGKFIVKDRVYYQRGFESVFNIIQLAKHLMYHGIIGHTENRVTRSRSGYESSFEPARFAELARLKLHMSRNDAWALTMTEFIAMWSLEYPPTQEELDQTITNDEYDDFWSKLESAQKGGK